MKKTNIIHVVPLINYYFFLKLPQVLRYANITWYTEGHYFFF